MPGYSVFIIWTCTFNIENSGIENKKVFNSDSEDDESQVEEDEGEEDFNIQEAFSRLRKEDVDDRAKGTCWFYPFLYQFFTNLFSSIIFSHYGFCLHEIYYKIFKLVYAKKYVLKYMGLMFSLIWNPVNHFVDKTCIVVVINLEPKGCFGFLILTARHGNPPRVYP